MANNDGIELLCYSRRRRRHVFVVNLLFMFTVCFFPIVKVHENTPVPHSVPIDRRCRRRRHCRARGVRRERPVKNNRFRRGRRPHAPSLVFLIYTRVVNGYTVYTYPRRGVPHVHYYFIFLFLILLFQSYFVTSSLFVAFLHIQVYTYTYVCVTSTH